MSVNNSVLQPGPTTYGTIREYVCDSDTVMQGYPRITCQEDSMWSYTDFYCIRKYCEPNNKYTLLYMSGAQINLSPRKDE